MGTARSKQPNELGAKPLETVRIGPNDVNIEFTSLNGEIFGDYSYINNLIRIEKTLTGGPFVDTLLHEMLHAIWRLGQLKDVKETEERTVSVTASYLAQIIRDNPELIAWLQKEMSS
jgi:hypothetical protein